MRLRSPKKIYAALLALAAGGTAYQVATGLCGIDPGVTAQLLSAVIGALFGASYDTLVGRSADGSGPGAPRETEALHFGAEGEPRAIRVRVSTRRREPLQ